MAKKKKKVAKKKKSMISLGKPTIKKTTKLTDDREDRMRYAQELEMDLSDNPYDRTPRKMDARERASFKSDTTELKKAVAKAQKKTRAKKATAAAKRKASAAKKAKARKAGPAAKFLSSHK